MSSSQNSLAAKSTFISSALVHACITSLAFTMDLLLAPLHEWGTSLSSPLDASPSFLCKEQSSSTVLPFQSIIEALVLRDRAHKGQQQRRGTWQAFCDSTCLRRVLERSLNFLRKVTQIWVLRVKRVIAHLCERSRLTVRSSRPADGFLGETPGLSKCRNTFERAT